MVKMISSLGRTYATAEQMYRHALRGPHVQAVPEKLRRECGRKDLRIQALRLKWLAGSDRSFLVKWIGPDIRRENHGDRSKGTK